MRIKIRVLTLRQQEAEFIFEHVREAFGERAPVPEPPAEPEARPIPPPAYGAASGSASVGVG